METDFARQFDQHSERKTCNLTKVCNIYTNIYVQALHVDRQTLLPQKHCIKSYVDFLEF